MTQGPIAATQVTTTIPTHEDPPSLLPKFWALAGIAAISFATLAALCLTR